jgi:pilus assembly protein CpaC
MIAARTTQIWRSRHRSRRPAAFFAALVVYIIVVLVAAPQAQSPQAFTPGSLGSTPSSPPIRDAISGSEIDLLVGRSAVLNVGSTIARVSLTVPDIADALVTGPTQLLIHGKQPGIISLFVWDKGGAIKTFEVNVRRDLTPLKEQLRQLFPVENITVLGSGKDIVLSGIVAGQYVVDKAAEVAAGYVEKKDNVVNLLKQQEGVASNQVMLRVRFAEVSRSAMQELGASLFANGSGTSNQWFGRTAPPGVPGPTFDEGRLVFSDFLNLFVFNAKEQLGGVVRALQNKGLFQSLAEPNLIATNGKEASFLAGGEYPYPVIQPAGTGGSSVTIQFKEFGVRLNFTPTVLGGDLIHLKVRPEVSALDFAQAIELEGFRIPALSTRRTETEVELRDGQTFAIAGLLNNTLTSSMSKIPGIGDIPILGLLFRSKAHQKNQTELVVMITPTIIRRGQSGVSEGLPALVEPYMGRPDRTYPNPDAYTGSPRYPANQGAARGGNGSAPESPTKAEAPVTPAPIPSRPLPPPPSTSSGRPKPATSSSTVSGAPREITAVPAAPARTPSASAPAVVPSMPMTTGGSAPQSMPPSMPSSMPQSMPTTTGGSAPQSMPSSMPQSMPPSMPPTMPPTSASQKAAPAAAPVAEPAPLTKEQRKALEKARAEERKAEAKRKADEDKKAEAERKQLEKLEKERAKRQAEIARKSGEQAKQSSDDDARRDKALAEAAMRLKEAQAAYQAELEKKGGKGDKQ